MTPRETAFLMVVILCLCAIIVSHLNKKTQYRRFLFRPVGRADIDPPTMEYFALRTRDLEGLGFHLLEDYVLREKPAKLVARFFINPLQSEVVSVYNDDGVLNTEFLSVFRNGACLVSAYFQDRKLRFNPDELLMFNMLPAGASLPELASLHRQRAAEYVTTHGCDLTPQPLHWLREVQEYVNQLQCWLKYEQGFIPQPFSDVPKCPCIEEGTTQGQVEPTFQPVGW